jgi:hypothetical protein
LPSRSASSLPRTIQTASYLLPYRALADANEVVGTIGRALRITSSDRSQALELVTAHLTELPGIELSRFDDDRD